MRSWRTSLVAVLIAAGCLLACREAGAQTRDARYTLILRGIQAEDALRRFANVTGADLLYDAALVAERPLVYCGVRDGTAEDILRCIVQQAGLDYYITSSGTFVLTERPEQAPRRVALTGVVVDAATGEPLPYANVYLEDVSAGTSANESGFFSFGSLLPGQYTIVASYIGFRPTANTVNLLAGETTPSRVSLVSEPVRYEPVIVDGLAERMTAELLGRTSVTTFVESAAAGFAATDVIRSVAEVSGIGTRNPLGQMRIQGGEAGEHIVTLDGAPVFYPTSFGSLVGAFSPLAIGRATVHKAGFGAGTASQLSGVIALEHDYSASAPGVSMLLDPTSFNVDARLPIVIDSRAGIVAASVRTSLWDVYRQPSIATAMREWNLVDPVLSATLRGDIGSASRFSSLSDASDVGFLDLHLATRLPLSAFRTLRVSGYYGASRLDATALSRGGLLDRSYTFSEDGYDWNNIVATASHDWIAGSRVLLSANARFSSHLMDHRYQSVDSTAAGTGVPDEDAIGTALSGALEFAELNADRNEIREGAIGFGATVAPSQRHHVTAGVEAVFTSTEFVQQTNFFADVESRFDAVRFVGWITDEWQVGRRSVVEAGSRFTFSPARQTLYAEPRLSVRGDVPAGARSVVSARLSAGLYRQFTSPFDLSSVAPSAIVPSVRFWIPVDETLAPPTAVHVASEAVVKVAGALEFGAEAYYKDLQRVLAIDYGRLVDRAVSFVGQSEYIGAASGYAAGFGLSVRAARGPVDVGLAYGRSDSRRTFPSRFGGRRVPVASDQPHRLDATAAIEVGRKLTFTASFGGRWGNSWAFRQAYYDFLAAHNSATAFPPFDLSRPDDHRLPAFHHANVGVSYAVEAGRTRVRLQVDVLNVYGRRNAVDWTIVPSGTTSDRYDVVTRRLPGVQPLISALVEF